MFSLMSVCLQGEGGPHKTITHYALDLSVQALQAPAALWTSDMGSLQPLPSGHQTWDP